MALAIPSDLIRKIQIKLRDGAGLPSYDPADPALRFFPPAEEAQWGIDPGAVPCPDSISFNTTEGCRRLLKSLDLHDSEFVSMNTQSKDSRKHQKVDDGMILSDYLSIEIRRHIEGERDLKISSVNEPAQSSYALNSWGVDLEDYFSDAKKETKISFPEKSTASDNMDFFEKFESPEKVNSFATWDVDFPSTEPHPSDPFQEQSGGHLNDSSKLHYTSDTWQLDDLWATSSSNVSVNPSMFRADDDVYEDWQDFTGSRNTDFTSNILPDAGAEVILSKQSVDFDGDDFGSFLQFGEDSSQQSVTQPQDLFYGIRNGWDEAKVAPPEDPMTIVDKLLSQMHDLSFIPEDNLSIPGRSQPSDRAL